MWDPCFSMSCDNFYFYMVTKHTFMNEDYKIPYFFMFSVPESIHLICSHFCPLYLGTWPLLISQAEPFYVLSNWQCQMVRISCRVVAARAFRQASKAVFGDTWVLGRCYGTTCLASCAKRTVTASADLSNWAPLIVFYTGVGRGVWWLFCVSTAVPPLLYLSYQILVASTKVIFKLIYGYWMCCLLRVYLKKKKKVLFIGREKYISCLTFVFYCYFFLPKRVPIPWMWLNFKVSNNFNNV